MDATTTLRKYLHLMKLVWNYRTYESRWEKDKATTDRANMLNWKRQLDAYLKKEKEWIDSMQMEIF